MKRNIIPVFLNQSGCSFHCIYCRQSVLWEKTGEMSPGTVKEFLETALGKIRNQGLVELAFYGGTFTGLPLEQQEAYLKIGAAAKSSGKISYLRLSTRPDLLSPPVITLLDAYKVDTVEVGAQSLADEVLQSSGRGYTRETVVEAVSSLQKAKFSVGLQLMCGLPGDTIVTYEQTLREVVKLKPDFVRLYPTLVFAHTPLASLYRRGEYQPLNLETAVEWGVLAKETLESQGIKVIRMGLHLSLNEELKSQIVAGPAHSAYGQMVKSRILRKKIQNILEQETLTDKEVEFIVPPKLVSDFLGVEKEAFNYLKNYYPASNFSWKPASPSAKDITINTSSGSYSFEGN